MLHVPSQNLEQVGTNCEDSKREVFYLTKIDIKHQDRKTNETSCIKKIKQIRTKWVETTMPLTKL